MGKGALTGVIVAVCALFGVLAGSATAAEPLAHTVFNTTYPTHEEHGRVFFNFRIEGDYTRVECRLDDAPWVSCFPGWSTERPAASGVHVAQVRVTDQNDVTEDPPPTQLFYVNPPAAIITGGPSYNAFITTRLPSWHFGTYSQEPDPNFGGFVCEVVRVDNYLPIVEIPEEKCGADWTPPRPLLDGDHILNVSTYDKFGSRSYTVEHAYFTVDTLGPKISLSAPGRIIKGMPAKVMIQIVDQSKFTADCTFDRKPIDCSPRTFRHLEPGSHVVRITAVDRGANKSRARAHIRVAKR